MQSGKPNDPSWQAGNIYIKPVRAELTVDTNAVTSMSPYCVFSIHGGTEAKSHTCNGGGKTPKWSDKDKDELSVKAKRGDFLMFEVWNHNTIGKDVLVGKGVLKVDHIADEDNGDVYQYMHKLYQDEKFEKEVGKLLFAAAVTQHVEVQYYANNVDDRHKDHMNKAATFKEGILNFKPVKAHLTHDTDLIRKMSTMVVITNPKKQKFKSSVCHMGGKDPHWEDQLKVEVVKGDKLKLEVINHHTIGKDELVGECTIDVDEILNFKRHYQETIDLTFEGKPAGHIELASSLITPLLIEDTSSKSPEVRHKMHKRRVAGWKEGYIYLRPYTAQITRDTSGTLKMMEPYVIIKHGDKQFKTAVGHTKNPDWDGEFRIYVKRGEQVTVECWDHMHSGEDKLIGTHYLVIDDIIDSDKHYEYKHTLWYEKEKVGAVGMSASLISGVLSEVLIERAKRRAEIRAEVYEDVKLFFEIVEKIGRLGH